MKRLTIEKAYIPEFAEMANVIKPWPPIDPPPDIYKVIEKEQLVRLVSLEIKFRQELLKIQQNFYNELSKLF